MTNAEKIQLEIEKQINAGFNAQEIRQNLLLQNFTNTEINDGLRRRPAPRGSEKPFRFGVWSLLLSAFFVLRGFIYLATNPAGSAKHTLGVLFILGGLAGVIIKGFDVARR